MDKFWAEMIMEGKATFSDIKSEARRNGVKKIFDQYLQEGKIDQDLYNEYLELETE